MRKVALLGLGLVLLTGCNKFPWNNPNPNPKPAPNEPPPPQVSQLVSYLNENARKCQAVQSTHVELDARKKILGMGLSGKLVCEKPRNFRLKANISGQPGVDLGSNDNEFWFWTSKESPPYVMHCAYQDIAQKPIAVAIPFQPDMIIAAFGLAEYDPNKNYDLKPTPQTLELIESTVTPNGKRARKITVFNRYETEAPKPQVVAHILKDDATGNVLCAATIKEVTIDPVTKAVLPRKVQLSWPAESMEVTLNMPDIQSVQLNPTQKERLFTRRDLDSFPGFDMARGQPDSARGYTQNGTGGIQRTGGQIPGRGGW